MKKIISILLILCMLLSSSLSALAYDPSKIDGLINKLLSYSPKDRTNLITPLRALIINDSGVQVLIGTVTDYADGKSSIFDSILEDVFQYTDTDTVIRFLKSLTCIDSSIRRKYSAVLLEKEGITLSDTALRGMNALLAKLYAKHPNLQELFEQDGITPQVMANALGAVRAINDGESLFAAGENHQVSLHYLSPSFAQKLDDVWAGYGEGFQTKAMVEGLANQINTEFSATDRKLLAEVLTEVGIYKPRSVSPSPSPIGSVGSGKLYENENLGIFVNYEQIPELEGLDSSFLENGIILKVSVTNQEGTDTTLSVGQEVLLTLPLNQENLMIFHYENGETTPLKYSVTEGDSFHALIDRGGYYIIKSMPNYFEDADGWGSAYIEALYNRGIINGKGEHIFMPEDNITREEFVKLVVELFGMTDPSAKSDYKDVDPDSWYYPYVATAAHANIIQGVGDGNFGVGQNIKRQDMAKIIANILEEKGMLGEKAAESVFADHALISDYAKEAALSIYHLGIISGDENTNFHPHQFATRQEAAKMMYGMLGVYITKTAVHE